MEGVRGKEGREGGGGGRDGEECAIEGGYGHHYEKNNISLISKYKSIPQ